MVERRADPADRRAWRLFLTERANGLLSELRPLALNLFDEAMTGLSAPEREALHEMLERVRVNLARRPTTELAANG